MKKLTQANVRGLNIRQQLRERHIEVAKQARRKVERQQGRHPTVTVVDGRRDVSERTVKENGQIVYLFDSVGMASDFTINELRQIAPVDEGDFQSGFVTLVNGVEGDPKTAPPGAEIVIIDREPYSRRLERGWSLQAPNGVFEVTAKLVKRRLKMVNVKFDYVPLVGAKSRVPAIKLKSKVV